MNNTWVKLYRKINANSIMRDPVALQLFIWILTNVDKDTGVVDFGRFFVAKQLRVNPNTLYSALKRLVQKYKVCKISSTAEYTTISLLNWSKYQPQKIDINTSVNSSSTTTQQPVNTLQEIENKELRKERHSSMDYLLNLPTNDLAEFTLAFTCTDRQVINKAQGLYDYCVGHGRTYKDYKAMLRNALRRDFGDRVASPVFSPDLPAEMDEVGLERLREMKDRILGGKLKN